MGRRGGDNTRKKEAKLTAHSGRKEEARKEKEKEKEGRGRLGHATAAERWAITAETAHSPNQSRNHGVTPSREEAAREVERTEGREEEMLVMENRKREEAKGDLPGI